VGSAAVVLLASLMVGGVASANASNIPKASDDPSTDTATSAVQTVVYEITGANTTVADLTYTNSQGTSTQAEYAHVPDNITVQRPTGSFFYISAQNDQGYGPTAITCTVIADGRQIRKNTSTGAYAIVTCSGSVPTPPKTGSGYDLVGSDGGVFVFPVGQSGGYFGSLPGLTPPVDVDNVVGIVPTNSYRGYDLVASDGGVFVFPTGQPSGYYGSLPGLGVNANDIVGIVPTDDYHGYDLVGSDGGVFVFPVGQSGGYFGSLPGRGVNVNNIVGIAVTGDDGGYWLAGSTGHIYNLGDAPAVQSPIATYPIVGIAGDATSKGGWLVASNGEVFPFGNAETYGTLPATGIPADDVVSIVPTPSGDGYWIIGDDGNVRPFGDATTQGTLPSLGVSVTNIVGAVPTG